MKTIENEVKSLIVYVVGCRLPLRNEEKLIDDLGMDSLYLVELVISLEDRFKISIDDEQFMKCVTVQDVINLMEESVKPEENENKEIIVSFD